LPGKPSGHEREFARVLRRRREAAGLTQAELAAAAGLGVRTVSNLERGINRQPYPSTVRVIAEALSMDPAGRRELMAAAGRGRDEPTESNRPIGGFVGARPSGALVGREPESATIGRVLSASMEGGGRAVLLAGEPGIGKTRLAQEAVLRAGELGYLVAVGRCYPHQSEAAYAPFLELMSALHREAPPAVRASIRDRWPSLEPLLPEYFRSDHDSAALRQMVRSADDGRLRLHHAVASYVTAVSEQSPVALVFDDLHWADGASIELLAHLIRSTYSFPVVVLGAYRDAEARHSDRLPEIVPALRRERLAEVLTLRRLDRSGTARLVAHRLEEAPVSDELAAVVHRYADGNPLFTVEMVMDFMERGELSVVDGRWDRHSSSEVVAPVSVSDVIRERVSRLASSTQTLLRDVSVFGDVFGVDEFAALAADDGDIEEALDEAVFSGLLTDVGDGYAFDHTLTQQALYSSLSPAARRRTHLAAGAALERQPAPVRRRRAAEIARHLEAGGAPERAVEYWLLAGDALADLHSPAEALRYYRQAEELGEGLDAAGAVGGALERSGRVLLTTANYDAAADHLIRAEKSYRRIKDDGARLRVEGAIAHALFRRGTGEAAAARLAGVLDEFDADAASPDQRPGVAVLLTGLARVRMGLGQPDLALHAAEQAAELARDQGLVTVAADADAIQGTVLLFLDRPDDATEALERALAREAVAQPVTINNALMSMAWANMVRGRLARGRQFIARGLELNRRCGDSDGEALNLAGLGLNLYYAGDWSQADRHLSAALELARLGSPTLFSGMPPAYLAVLRQGQGALDIAEGLYDEAAGGPDVATFALSGFIAARRAQIDVLRGDPDRALSRLDPWLRDETPTRLHDVMLLATASEVCLALGLTDRASSLADHAIRRADATLNGVDRIDALRIKGLTELYRGQPTAALSAMQTALTRAQTLPHPAAEARLWRDLAQVWTAAGDQDAARSGLIRALAIFEGLGAALDVAGLRSALDTMARTQSGC
jgi:tetratricopeptide (TPR) repeat protein/transcriptional regulator with XRE-family HTH domain